MLGSCDFCGQREVELRNSHILPEFLHRPIYGPNGTLVAINGQGRYGSKPLQNGLKQHLFCDDCEGRFSREYERPFSLLWMDRARNPLPDPWPAGQQVEVKFDYASFKLFHLLNLYRAATSTLPTYRKVELGPHRANLRSMLMARDPGDFGQYQVSGMALYHAQSRALEWTITAPQKRRYEQKVAWEWMYGGVAWLIATSGGFPPFTKKFGLQADGSMRITGHPWQDFSIMHEASAMLRGKDERPK